MVKKKKRGIQVKVAASLSGWLISVHKDREDGKSALVKMRVFFRKGREELDWAAIVNAMETLKIVGAQFLKRVDEKKEYKPKDGNRQGRKPPLPRRSPKRVGTHKKTRNVSSNRKAPGRKARSRTH